MLFLLIFIIIINFRVSNFIVLLLSLMDGQEGQDGREGQEELEGHGMEDEQCELCLQRVSADKTYAGVFHRICYGCYQLQISDLELPIHPLTEGIFIGNERAARNENLLREHKIGAICVCGSDLKVFDYQNLKVQRKVVKLLDTATQNIIDCIPEVVEWLSALQDKKVNILVHCAGGVSRSASICIAFYMKKHRLSFQEAYLLVKRSRKCIKPNFNFTKQLKTYEKLIKESNW